MKNIAVIGGGIFGSTTAIELSQNGFNVSLFEKAPDILMGATSKSLLRLHLGFHYPRDLDTAIQSKRGYKSFVTKFPEVTDFSFTNYYAISKTSSRINRNDFLIFAKNAKLDMSECSNEVVASYGLAVAQCSGIFSNKEGVISILKLREHLLDEISTLPISLNLNTEVTKAKRNNDKWILTSSDNIEREFDFVVRSTYGHDKIEIIGAKMTPVRRYEYHKTLVLKVKVNLPDFGLTIIDGDFLTILPKAFDESHLLYGPNLSVLKKHVGVNYPESWDLINSDSDIVHNASKKIIRRYQEWFPNNSDIAVKGTEITVRAIDSSVKATDRRVSLLENRAENFIDICSGKIDHCVDIAKSILSEVKNKF
jgi:glycine/D-amino acid oxidase-like deaminating enzyme